MSVTPRPSPRIEEPIARRLAPIVRDMIADEVRRVRADKVATVEEEIMGAAIEVGRALDTLAQRKFTRAEPAARIGLERAATRLRRVMEKHGRMP